MQKININQNGFSLVEVIVSTVIFGLVAVTFAGLFAYAQQSANIAGAQVRANTVAEEALEAVRNIRDNNFSNLVDGTYGLVQSGGSWQLSGSSDTVDIFTRQVVISTINANTKQVSVQVTWQQNPQRTGDVSLLTYLTNWRAITIPPTSWANPNVDSTFDLAGSANGLKVRVQGNYAYIIRSSATDLRIVNISNPGLPVLTGTGTIVGSPSDIFVSGNYAYVTSNDNSRELQIFNISNPASPILTGIYNASGNEDARAVYISGSRAYVVRASTSGPEFLSINITNPAAPTLSGSLELAITANDIFVNGNYAYIASTSNTQELQIVNISNPSLPSFAGSYNVSGNSDALSVTGFGNTILLGSSDTNMYIINVTNPASTSLISTYDTDGNVNEIDLNNSNTYAFIASSASNEFQVINITNPATPTLFGQDNVSGTLFGIDYDPVLDRAFTTNDDNGQELIIFEPT